MSAPSLLRVGVDIDKLAMASFRTTSAFEIQPGAVAAWIRQGELKAELIECKKWDRTAFRNALTLIKPLTKKKEPKDSAPID
jgi:HTH-type transcriptional regulator/antitoxin HigA